MKRCLILLFSGTILLAYGCATSLPYTQTHPDVELKFKHIQSVSVLPPRVIAYELPAFGEPEKQTDWEPVIQKILLTALEKKLASQGIALQYLSVSSLSGDQQATLKETLALLDLIVFNNRLPQMGPGFGRVYEFDDSLGSEVGLLDPGVDALMQINITEILPTGGQQAAEMGKSIISNTILLAVCVAMIAVAVAAGGGGGGGCPGPYEAKWGEVALEISMIDAKTGGIIFSKKAATTGGENWKDSESAKSLAEELIEKIFKSLPNRQTEKP